MLIRLWRYGPHSAEPEKPRLSFAREGRVPHISLVFCEMWDTTALSF
jgi:hypothetical protein